jgi:hypothetical protein
MAGVAGPMLRYHRTGGVRFLAGLIVGGAAGGVALAIPAYLLGSLLHAVLAPQLRLWVLVLVCVVFGTADLANRTPHVWRQVPQRLLHTLQPGTLGLTWGFDLGLLFTTQKVASLIWVAVAAVTLIQPALAWSVLVGVAVLASLAVLVGSTSERTADWLATKRKPRLVRHLRRAAGVLVLVLAVLTAGQAWIG